MGDFDKKYNRIANGFIFIWILCAFAPVGLFLWFYYRNEEAMPENIADWGVVGDFVGGLSNPLISSMTFMALIFTILQNQKVLKFTEEELAETRKEIELTREANEKQANEFKNQNELAVNQAEVQTTIEALLKGTELVNRSWTKPTDIPIQQPGKNGMIETTYYSLSSMAAPGFGLKIDELGSDFILALSEVVQLLTVHKKLLERLQEISPNNPMIESVAWLVKEPMGWLALNAVSSLNEQHIAVIEDLKEFYEGQWKVDFRDEWQKTASTLKAGKVRNRAEKEAWEERSRIVLDALDDANTKLEELQRTNNELASQLEVINNFNEVEKQLSQASVEATIHFDNNEFGKGLLRPEEKPHIPSGRGVATIQPDGSFRAESKVKDKDGRWKTRKE